MGGKGWASYTKHLSTQCPKTPTCLTTHTYIQTYTKNGWEGGSKVFVINHSKENLSDTVVNLQKIERKQSFIKNVMFPKLLLSVWEKPRH